MSRLSLHPTKSKLAIYEHNQASQLVFMNPEGINLKILKAGFEQLDVMLGYYSKVTVVLLQLHQHTFTKGNQSISALFKKLITQLKKHYRCRIGYIWVREQEQAVSQHYHAAIMLSGHVCQKSYEIDKLAKELWHQLDPANFSYKVKNRVYRIQTYLKNHELNAARLRLSYMAKNKGKSADKGVQNYSTSRLKPKQYHRTRSNNRN
jgi:hypothetical protein